jgi:L-malate glycosyltransferase
MSIVEGENDLNQTSKKARVLVVPGFVVDTYSEIERQYVDLCSSASPEIEFIWLVPDISCKYNRFERSELKTKLEEPLWMSHLRTNGVPYIIGNISKYNLISNFLLCRSIFRMSRVDAVYTHFGFERFWVTFFGKLWGKVTIWNEHWHSLGTRYVLAKKLFYRYFVDDFIAVSDFIAKTLPHGSRVHVVRNAIHTGDLSGLQLEEKMRLRRQLGIPENLKVVLLVSAFRPNKRYDLAMQICERVLAQRSDVVFVFLGEGSTRPWVKSKIQELGFDGKILSPGHVDNVDDYYRASDICILTSIGEPCALAIVEAMKFSKPLIAFDSGGTPEVIRTGETGFLVSEENVSEFSTRIIELIDNDQMRSRIGNNALKAVKKQADRRVWTRELAGLLIDIVNRNKLNRH